MKFYQRDTARVARELIGMKLVRNFEGKRMSGIIVETEAYLGQIDAAAHTFQGRRTERVRSMYLPGGHVYVYLIYGMYHCLNVVTRKEGEPEAVLIRAVEPCEGIAERTDGPGRLCNALRIDKKIDGENLDGAIIFIEKGEARPLPEEIEAGPRIGVDYAGDAASWPLRFSWRGNAFVSRPPKRPKKASLKKGKK